MDRVAGAVLGLRSDVRLRRLGWFVATAALIAGIGVAVDSVLRHHPGTAASLLRFYWFRLSDVMLPVGIALWGLSGLSRLHNRAALGQSADWRCGPINRLARG